MTIEDEVRALAPKLPAEAETAAAGLSLRTKVELAGAAAIALVAFLVWTQWPAKPVPEVITAAPAVTQADGSTELARTPDAHPTPAPHIIPKGFHEERREQLTVAPTPAAAASGYPPVRIALSVVSNDREHRVVASSPDGQIVDAVDIPITPAMMPPEPKCWAAGLSYSTEREVGVWLERDLGRLRLGAEVAKGAGRPRAELRVGVAF